MENVYKKPESDLQKSDPENDAYPMFPRFSAWWVFILEIITFSIYKIVWLHRRTRILNEYLPTNPITDDFRYTAIVLYIVGVLILPFLSGVYEYNEQLKNLATFSQIVAGIILLVWIFKFHNRLEELVQSRGDTEYRLNGVLTFFFNDIYLQYKINQQIDINQPTDNEINS